jgi:hypothetical protein
MSYRATDPGDTATVQVVASGGGWAILWEIEGVVAPDVESFVEADTGTAPASVGAGTVAVTDAALILSGVCVHCSDWGGNGDTQLADDASFTADAHYFINNTIDSTEPFTTGTSHPLTWGGHYSPTVAGSYGPTLAMSSDSAPPNNYGGQGGLQMAFLAQGGQETPPSPGQDLGWIVPTAVPDGEDFTWDIGFAFSDGSLEVRLDGMDQTAAVTSYDGACGEFTVSFEVQPGELLEARGIGR